jgi:hypothetical protein
MRKRILLEGAVSPETAVVIEDYPYGFRLRCKKRYWLEYRKGYGNRLCTQTTNPKHLATTWNAVKASTFSSMGFMYRIDDPGAEDHGHICWSGAGYSNPEELVANRASFYNDLLPERKNYFDALWRAAHKGDVQGWAKYWTEKGTKELALSLSIVNQKFAIAVCKQAAGLPAVAADYEAGAVMDWINTLK